MLKNDFLANCIKLAFYSSRKSTKQNILHCDMLRTECLLVDLRDFISQILGPGDYKLGSENDQLTSFF